ncbi:MAG: hypothetical protein ACJ74H_19535 [Thermoanaerobaculia bacterium]
MRLRPVLQIFAHLAGSAFLVLPKKKRFAAARRIALMLAPLLRRTSFFERRPSLIDGPREEAMRMVIRMMTRARVEFDPDVDVIDEELIAGAPVLIVSAHFLLNVAMTRVILDAGGRMTGSVAAPREPVYYWGTTVPLPHLYVSPLLFLQLRRTLAEGSVVFVTAEEAEPHENWVAVDTAAGRRYVSPAVFSFIARTRMPAVFGATYLSPEGRLTITYEQPRGTTADAMCAEFCEFLRRHAAAVMR